MDLTQWIVFIITVRETLGKISFKGCLKEHTYGSFYVDFFPVEMLSKTPPEGRGPQDSNNHHYIEFYVKSQSNARIFLGESKTTGYEVILGARSNKFSQIRIIDGANQRLMKTEKTKEIVSDTEHRGFWIECDSYGIIMVGTMNSSEPILTWKNSNPFRINVVSFSTWSNVMGTWHFACSNTSTPGIMDEDEDRNLTANERLRSDLLSYYDPSNFPQKDGELNENVELYLDALYFHLDEKNGQLEISGVTYLKWKDWKLMWNETDYDGINYIHVTSSEIWTPNIYAINSIAFEKKSLLARRRAAVITNVGQVTWRTSFRSVTHCILGFKNWPSDTHNCSLTLGFLTEPIGVVLKNMVFTKIHRSKWEIKNVNGTSTDKSCVIDINFQRKDEPIIRILVIPSFLSAAVLSLLSFMVNPNSSVKLVFNCLSLFILMLTTIALADDLPMMIWPIPNIVHLFSWSIIAMSIPILLFISLSYIPPEIVLPAFLSKLLNSNIAETLCFSCATPEIQPDMEENANNSVRLCVLIERFVLFIYFTILALPFAANFTVIQKFL